MMKTQTIIRNIALRCVKSSRIALPLVTLLLAFTACNVEQFPDYNTPPENSVNFTLDLHYETDLPLYKEITYDTRNSQYALRYIIKAYPEIQEGRYDYNHPTIVQTVFNDKIEELDRRVEVQLPEGNYQFAVWTDYVTADGHKAVFYNAENFSDVSLNEENGHQASNNFRDAFRALQEVAVVADGSAVVENTRPLGKYVIISDDVQDFIQKVIEMRTTRGDENTRDINPNDFIVTVQYQGFMPSAFNILSNKAVDSLPGVVYQSALTQLSPTEMELAFDYVFTNPEETRVQVALNVTEKSTGAVIGQTGTFEIPLFRSHLTIVRGQFLTAQQSGGMVIDPSFDGEFNLEIH